MLNIPADRVQNHDRRPHHLDPHRQTCRLVLVAKNFLKIPGVSHTGLSTTAKSTAAVLRRAGYWVEVWSPFSFDDLKAQLAAADADSLRRGLTPISHLVVSAPWLRRPEYEWLSLNYQNMQSCILNHSGCCFLSIDKFGIKTNRSLMDLEMLVPNFCVAANNSRVQKALSGMFGQPVQLLRNLYDINTFRSPVVWPKPPAKVIRIGSFGAARPWKNQLAAAEAALMLANQLGKDLELYVNSKRPDGGERMIESRAEIFDNLPNAKLIEVPWAQWPNFRKIIGRMDLALSPSHDETFNVVTADGIAEGVPSVVTSSIEWAPKRWWADPCDPEDMVKVGLQLMNDSQAVADGRKALTDYVSLGLQDWITFLNMRR